jgi:hypothetical protein
MTTQFPGANIITDQFPYPFSALKKLVQNMILGAGNSSVVWRPGAVSAGNVFATWAEVVAAVAGMNGAVTIALDTDLAAAVVPPGAYDLRPAGISGPVTMVNGSKNPPFAAPFFTLGPGAVTIAGLSGLDDVSVDNQSTVAVVTTTTNGSFALLRRASIFQEPGAGAFLAVTGGDFALYMSAFSTVTTPGGGTPAVEVTAPGTLALGVQDTAAFDTNMLTAPAGTVTVSVASGATYNTQAGAPAIVPVKMVQKGTATLAGGATAAIPVFLSATARIFLTVKDGNGTDALTAHGYAVLPADRVVGAPGSIVIRAFAGAVALAAQDGANGADVDWEVIL